jgi:NAD(P)-dependent dehydrogenase (short-subunit alcohol dehydrogenase family)
MTISTNYNPYSLVGKKYLVTGAASGIGKSTCEVLSKLSADLILVDINLEGLLETKKTCKSSDEILVLDLTQASKIKEAILGVVSHFGKINGIIHLAGKPYISPLKSISEEKCAEIYQLNTYSAIELAKIFCNRYVYSGQKGSIVFVSSVYGFVGSSANVGYAMSKSALHGITKSLAIELADKGIRVNCVAPGFIKTNMLDTTSEMFNDAYTEKLNNLHPLGLGEAEDVALSIAYLLSDASKWVTGSILSVDGGFTAQ